MAMLQPSTGSGIPFDAAKLDRLMEVAPRSPCQNGYCERAIGSIRLDCLDHLSWSASGISAICFALTRPTTILFHNTHPSMRLKRRGFADLDAIPWGDLGSASRDERRAEPPVRRALIG